MNTLSIGDKAPDFNLPSSTGQSVCLKDFKGKNVVLYFYPKDSTPGCTVEACDFRDHLGQLEDEQTVVLGVSKDSLKSHDKFIEKHALTFPLLSDEATDVIQMYGVLKEKSMFGKKYMGIERSTFLIDQQGVIRHIWRKVKVKGHVQAVLEAIRALYKEVHAKSLLG